MNSTNPEVSFSGHINGSNIQGLLSAIKTTTGLSYGYMPQRMMDNQFYSVVLTLCGKSKLSKLNRALVHTTITSWCIGYGLGCPVISWSDLI